MVPTTGQTVLYTLTEQDAAEINQRRKDWRAHNDPDSARTGFVAHIGNGARAGDIYPAMIVRTWGVTETSAVQLQVFLDGNDTFWATSRSQGEGEGHFRALPRP